MGLNLFNEPDEPRKTRKQRGHAATPGTGPSVLIAYGERNVHSLRTCLLEGKLIRLK